MRFKITFNRSGGSRMLPVDYQYYISAWIYRVIGKADHEFALFLHQHGYRDGKKKFKLFCYSPLDIGEYVLWKAKALFEVRDNQLTLFVSFAVPEAAEKFIMGLFTDQKAYLGDRFNGLDLSVVQVERLPDPEISRIMIYKSVSPVVVSVQGEQDMYARYLSPDDVSYPELLKSNLEQKWKTLQEAVPLSGIETWEWEKRGEIRSKLVTIRTFTPQESKVRGFLYSFSLTAPVEFHHLILSAGIGEKNSVGFGWVDVIKDFR
jgi:CRISPR-associated endoribonuclease Cas6